MRPITAETARIGMLRRLWRGYLRPQLGRLLALAPMTALAAATSGGYVFITKFAGDQIQKGDSALVYQVPIWILAVAGLRAAALYGQAVLTSDIALRALRDVQQAMFNALVHADFVRVEKEPLGALVSRFTNDLSVVSEGLVRSIGQLTRDGLTLVAALGAMLWIDWPLASLVIAVFALAASPLQRIGKRARRDSHAAQAQMGDLASSLTESFSAARLVRSYGLEDRETGRLAAQFEARRKAQMRLVRNRARADPLLEILGALALALVFALIGLRINQGEASVGDIFAFIATIATASGAARGLGSYNTLLNETLAALGRVFALLDEPRRIRDAPKCVPLRAARPRIRFEHVGFSYGGGQPVLEDISFEIAPGESIALVGPSGAGKSTLLNLLPRLHDVSSGHIWINDQDIREVTLASLRGAMALVSQDVLLFDETIGANIALGKAGASLTEIWAAARAAVAEEFIQALPQGLETRIGAGGIQLSGGQRQRIALARAFLRDAPILLLDEATSALDSESEEKVQAAVTRLSEGRTSLMVAHRLASIQHVDRLIVLDQGRICETGTHHELLQRNGLYARLFRLQSLTALTPGAAADPPAHSPKTGS